MRDMKNRIEKDQESGKFFHVKIRIFLFIIIKSRCHLDVLLGELHKEDHQDVRPNGFLLGSI